LPKHFTLSPWLVAYFAAFAVGTLILLHLVRWRARRALAALMKPVVVRLDPSTFTVSGEGCPTATFPSPTIDHFEAGERIALVTTDGTRHDLPLRLAPRQQVAFAQRLNEAKAQVRAQPGYRG
jgi:hypothetical protein